MNQYNVALADWFHTPEILEIDLGDWSGQPGTVLRVKAIDDVLVSGVNVRIQGRTVRRWNRARLRRRMACGGNTPPMPRVAAA